MSRVKSCKITVTAIPSCEWVYNSGRKQPLPGRAEELSSSVLVGRPFAQLQRDWKGGDSLQPWNADTFQWRARFSPVAKLPVPAALNY